jgi:hypothetical protein
MIYRDALSRKEIVLLEGTFFFEDRCASFSRSRTAVSFAILARRALGVRTIRGGCLEPRPTEGAGTEEVLYSAKIEMTETEMPPKKLLLRGRKILISFFGYAKVQLGESSLRHGTAQNAKDWEVGLSVERASNGSFVVCHGQSTDFTIDGKPACSGRSLLVGMLRAEESASRLRDITREQT